MHKLLIAVGVGVFFYGAMKGDWMALVIGGVMVGGAVALQKMGE